MVPVLEEPVEPEVPEVLLELESLGLVVVLLEPGKVLLLELPGDVLPEVPELSPEPLDPGMVLLPELLGAVVLLELSPLP